MKAYLLLLILCVVGTCAQQQTSTTLNFRCDSDVQCRLLASCFTGGCTIDTLASTVTLTLTVGLTTIGCTTGTTCQVRATYGMTDYQGCGYTDYPWTAGAFVPAEDGCQRFGDVDRGSTNTLVGDARTFDFYINNCIPGAFPLSTFAGTTTPADRNNWDGPHTIPTYNTQGTNAIVTDKDYDVTYTFQGTCLAIPVARSYTSGGTRFTAKVQGNFAHWTIRGHNTASKASNILLFTGNGASFDSGGGDTRQQGGLNGLSVTGSAGSPSTRTFFWALNRHQISGRKPQLTVQDLIFVDLSTASSATPPTQSSYWRGTLFFVGDGKLILSNVDFEGFDSTGRRTQNLVGSASTNGEFPAPSYGDSLPPTGGESSRTGITGSALFIEARCGRGATGTGNGNPRRFNLHSVSDLTCDVLRTEDNLAFPEVVMTNVLIKRRTRTSMVYVTAQGTTRSSGVVNTPTSDTFPFQSAGYSQTSINAQSLMTVTRNLITVRDNTTITMERVTVEDQRFTNANGGILYAMDSTVHVANSIFRRNTARITTNGGTFAGGLFHFRYRTNVTMRMNTFTSNAGVYDSSVGCSATNCLNVGLCIYQEDRTFDRTHYSSNGVYEDNTFTSNTIDGNGAAMYFNGHDINLALRRNKFDNGVASRIGYNHDIGSNNNAKAGCIYTRDVVDLRMWASKISGNTADHGGCFYFERSKVWALFQTAAADDWIQNNNIINNVTVGYNRGRGGGGAMAVIGDSEIVFENPRFRNNWAQYGGAIEIRESTLLMKSAVFDNNRAFYHTNWTREVHGAGGAIRAYDSIVKCESCNFVNNWAHNGGSIYAAATGARTNAMNQANPKTNPSLTLTQSTFDGSANGLSQTTPGGFAVYDGGAVYAESVDVTAWGTTFRRTSAQKGGAVRLVSVVDFESSSGHRAEFRGCTFDSNRAQGTAAEGTNLPVTLPVIHGGAISSNRPLRVVDSRFQHNWASLGNGGAIWADRMLTVENTLFESNSASFQRGGAIYHYPSVAEALSIRDSDFRANVAGMGGAVFSRTPNAMVDRCSFHSNLAEIVTSSQPVGTGGAIAFFSRATVMGSSFFANIARQSGGAIYTSAQLTVSDTTFTQNSASTSNSWGGAIRCVSDPNGLVDQRLTVSMGHFTSNTALQGGAVWSSCDNEFTSTTFEGNVASGAQAAGAIFCHNGNRRLRGCSITLRQSSVTGSRPSAILVQQTTGGLDNGNINIYGTAFSGSQNHIWSNANLRFFSAADSAGKMSSLSGMEARVWGNTHSIQLDGLSLSNGAMINANGVAAAVIGSLSADSSSSLNLENVARARTVGSSLVGSLSFAGTTPLELGGPVTLTAGSTINGPVVGNHNITIMSGGTQWLGGAIGLSGDTGSYFNVMPGAELHFARTGAVMYKSVKNWGTIRFLAFPATGSPGPFQLGGGHMIENAWRARIDCGPNVVAGLPIPTNSATTLAQGSWIHNWGNMTFNSQCTINMATILYGQSWLVFKIRSESDFDHVAFGGYAQLNGGVVGRDDRDFLLTSLGGMWEWGRDFGTAYPIIRLRSTYVERLHNRFHHRRILYVRNDCAATGRTGCTGRPVFFPIPGKSDQPPYIQYGPSPNRSVIFLVNPAPLAVVSPLLLLATVFFSFW